MYREEENPGKSSLLPLYSRRLPCFFRFFPRPRLSYEPLLPPPLSPRPAVHAISLLAPPARRLREFLVVSLFVEVAPELEERRRRRRTGREEQGDRRGGTNSQHGIHHVDKWHGNLSCRPGNISHITAPLNVLEHGRIITRQREFPRGGRGGDFILHRRPLAASPDAGSRCGERGPLRANFKTDKCSPRDYQSRQ